MIQIQCLHSYRSKFSIGQLCISPPSVFVLVYMDIVDERKAISGTLTHFCRQLNDIDRACKQVALKYSINGRVSFIKLGGHMNQDAEGFTATPTQNPSLLWICPLNSSLCGFKSESKPVLNITEQISGCHSQN